MSTSKEVGGRCARSADDAGQDPKRGLLSAARVSSPDFVLRSGGVVWQGIGRQFSKNRSQIVGGIPASPSRSLRKPGSESGIFFTNPLSSGIA